MTDEDTFYLLGPIKAYGTREKAYSMTNENSADVLLTTWQKVEKLNGSKVFFTLPSTKQHVNQNSFLCAENLSPAPHEHAGS